jgi:hypothetical protein
MIPDQILLFVVMLLLSYIFGNRLIPQLAVMILVVVEIITIATSTNDMTFYYYMVLFIVNLIYGAMSLIVKEQEVNP